MNQKKTKYVAVITLGRFVFRLNTFYHHINESQQVWDINSSLVYKLEVLVTLDRISTFSQDYAGLELKYEMWLN